MSNEVNEDIWNKFCTTTFSVTYTDDRFDDFETSGVDLCDDGSYPSNMLVAAYKAFEAGIPCTIPSSVHSLYPDLIATVTVVGSNN